MPELPEVETIRRAVAPYVEGRELTQLVVHDARWCQPLAAAALVDAVEGRRVERLGRRGKYLVWELTGEAFLLLHLRMTGTLLTADGVEPPPHTRVTFAFDGGARELRFVDPRRFGTGELALGGPALAAFLDARLGVEPLDPGFTVEHLRSLTKRSRAPIKAFLLDQRKIAGVGNIYADEALFRARIHPLRRADTLTRAQCELLRDAVIEALQAGIDAKGASIDDFRDPYGAKGSFQDRFLVHTREGEPCATCGNPIRKLRAAGRGTYVCERCQPKPRATRRRAAVASGAPATATPPRSARAGVRRGRPAPAR